MSGLSYCTVCDTVGTFGSEHEGFVRNYMIGTSRSVVFGGGDATSLLDYAQDFEALEGLMVEFGMASDWDEPFADSLMDDVPAPWLSTQPVRFPTMRVEWGA